MKTHSDRKSGLHPRNRHQAPYDFDALCQRTPELQSFVFVNEHGTQTLDFADPAAVKALNKALLALHYGIAHWDLPAGYLCPPIPGRVDYLHRVADLLAESAGKVPTGKSVRVLDIGVGANCIYPLLGAREYGWRFVGSDIDPVSVKAATLLAKSNGLGSQIECRLQGKAGDIFQGIVAPRERFALTLCNPPFHASLAEASKGTERKLRNLGKAATAKPVLNFGGQKAELWCEGGGGGLSGEHDHPEQGIRQPVPLVQLAGVKKREPAGGQAGAEPGRGPSGAGARDGPGQQDQPGLGLVFPRRGGQQTVVVANGAR